MGYILWIENFVHNLAKICRQLWICIIKSQSIVHTVGEKHLKDFTTGAKNRNTCFKKLSPTLIFYLCDKMQNKSSVVSYLQGLRLICIKIDLKLWKIIWNKSINRFWNILLFEKFLLNQFILILRCNELLMINEHIY